MTESSNKHLQRWQTAMQAMPLVAILRGVKPEEVVAVGEVLYECGFRILEVPLNSPDPYASIAALRKAMPVEVLVGAGTVLKPDQVDACVDAGGELIIAPNFSLAVAQQSAVHDMLYCPGVATPSEAFAALDAGAHALKFFPSEIIGTAGVKAMLAVLPKGTATLPVGGIDASNMEAYLDAGASGFGLGSSVYQPGFSLAEIKSRGRDLCDVIIKKTAKRLANEVNK